MKKTIFLFLLFTGLKPVMAQTVYDYVLTPLSATVEPNQSIHLTIRKLDSTGDRPELATDVGIIETPHWMLNGSSAGTTPAGTLRPDLTFLNATYTAPSVPPATNPVAIAVQFHPDPDKNQLVTLVCNVNIVSAHYKVVMDGEITGPKGIHYKLHGESFRNLQSYADGTAALISYDGSKKMHVTVSAAGLPGKMWLVSPLEYDIPLVFNIGNLKKSTKVPAKIDIENFSPSTMGRNDPENYWTPGGIQHFPGFIAHTFAGVFYQDAAAAARETGRKAETDKDFVARLKAHKGDPAYFSSAQGKADLLQLQKYMQEHGHGNIYSSGGKAPANASAYSKAFVQGMRGTQTNPGSYGTPPDANTPAVMGGILHFNTTFDSRDKTPTNFFEEAAPGGGLHGKINFYVKKL